MDGYRSPVCLFYATPEGLTSLTLKIILFEENINTPQETDLTSKGEKACTQYQKQKFHKMSHTKKLPTAATIIIIHILSCSI